MNKERKVLDYEITIVGQRREDSNDNNQMKLFPISKSNPSAKARNANFTPQRFFQCKLRPVLNNKFRLGGPPRLQTENYFENSHSSFFAILEELVSAGNIKQIEGTDRFSGKSEAIIIPGTIVTKQCGFIHNLQTVDKETRERKNLVGNRWKPATKTEEGRFIEITSTSSTVTVFIPEDELGNIDSHIQSAINAVKLYAVDIITTTTEKAGKTTVETTNQETSKPEELPAGQKPVQDNEPKLEKVV